MVNHLDVHTFIYFELDSSPIVTVWRSSWIILTAILKFNIKLLTTSNAQHPQAFSFSRGQKGQIFHCSLGDFVKLTAVPSFFHVCISDAAFLICWHN